MLKEKGTFYFFTNCQKVALERKSRMSPFLRRGHE